MAGLQHDGFMTGCVKYKTAGSNPGALSGAQEPSIKRKLIKEVGMRKFPAVEMARTSGGSWTTECTVVCILFFAPSQW